MPILKFYCLRIPKNLLLNISVTIVMLVTLNYSLLYIQNSDYSYSLQKNRIILINN